MTLFYLERKPRDAILSILFRMPLIFLLRFLTLAASAYSSEDALDLNDAENRTAKVLSVFNVISFPNDVCYAESGLNGTCFTSSECASKGGSASGACASSFGVCCVFSLSCGGTSSANNTYAAINRDDQLIIIS